MKAPMSTHSVTRTLAFILAALPTFALPTAQAKMPPSYHAKRILIGCWTIYGPQQPNQPFRSHSWRCWLHSAMVLPLFSKSTLSCNPSAAPLAGKPTKFSKHFSANKGHACLDLEPQVNFSAHLVI